MLLANDLQTREVAAVLFTQYFSVNILDVILIERKYIIHLIFKYVIK